MKNKIIAVFIAVSVFCLNFCMIASASSYLSGYSQAVGEAITDFWNTVGSVVSGDISLSDAKESLKDNAESFGNDLMVNYLVNADNAMDTMAFLHDVTEIAVQTGDGISDLITDLLGINGVQGGYDFNLKGSGAMVVCTRSDGSVSKIVYCDYGIVYQDDNGNPVSFTDCYDVDFAVNHLGYNAEFYDENGNLTSTGGTRMGNTIYNPEYYKLLGDWRYADGSEAEEADDPVGLPPDIDDASDDQLIDLLNDLIEQLNLQFPDLSTIEGLLSAILAKLGTLDSDNDNDILSAINNSLIDLNSSISDLKSENNFNIDLSDFFGDIDFSLDDIFSGNKVFSDNALSFYFVPKDKDYAHNTFQKAKDEVYLKFEFITNIDNLLDHYIAEFESLWEE